MAEKSSLKILVVDDDELDRIVVKRALAKATKVIDLTEASGFTQAIQLLKKQQYDCLILDYRLDGQDGLDLIKAIQTNELSYAPIVMLSGLDDETVMLNCLKEGAQDYLLKSEITTNSLMRAIRYAQERKQLGLQMHYLALHDTLTGLANRSLFIDSVKRAITRARRKNTYVAILFIDVDNFKSINDTLGHEAGDQFLISIAERIKTVIRDEDIVGRLGGDEFSVLIEGYDRQSSLIKVTQKLLDAIRKPVVIHNKTIHSTISIGIATYPSCCTEATALIKCADLAMCKTKQTDRNDYSFYSEDLQQLADNYANLKIDLYNALTRHEFELYYQPQIKIPDGSIAGVEALIRWHHPSRGLVPPDQFIPIAESCGLINSIGDWVIEEACKKLKDWLTKYTEHHINLTMAINVSACQIRHPDLQNKVCRILENLDIPYPQVELELTESALIDDIEHCSRKLKTFSWHGIQMAIDDFGTGYASFRHLQQLPLQTLKVDKSFIDQICTEKKNQEIVKAIIMMARALNMKVIAEGVETKQQIELLKELKCDILQGYYFSKPVPVEDMEKLLENPSSLLRNKQDIKQEVKKSGNIINNPRKRLTILLVEDDDIDAMAIEKGLKKLDNPPELLRAVDGLQALDRLHKDTMNGIIEPPYLILLDLNMPKMGGLEFLEEIRKDRSLHNNVIFVLTTSVVDRDQVAAYSKHISGYVVKSNTGPDYSHLVTMLNSYHNTVTLPH